MIVEGRPDFVVAFPGGLGTEDVISQALKAGLLVYRIGANGGVS